jgi:hypothetical protein
MNTLLLQPDALRTEKALPDDSFETAGVVQHPIIALAARIDNCDNEDSM